MLAKKKKKEPNKQTKTSVKQIHMKEYIVFENSLVYVVITDGQKELYSDEEEKNVSLSMVINDNRIFETELSVCFRL